jgi:DNA-binding response OmpR family regulator
MTMKRAIEMLERLANHPKKKISNELLLKFEQDFKEGKPDTFNNLIKLLRENIESDHGYIQDILEELQPKKYSPQKKK